MQEHDLSSGTEFRIIHAFMQCGWPTVRSLRIPDEVRPANFAESLRLGLRWVAERPRLYVRDSAFDEVDEEG
jgi:hypothetical protein